MVVQGRAELAKLSQPFERLDLAEYGRKVDAELIGGPMPGKVVKAWLIAVSIFQQTADNSQFADIPIHDKNATIAVM